MYAEKKHKFMLQIYNTGMCLKWMFLVQKQI